MDAETNKRLRQAMSEKEKNPSADSLFATLTIEQQQREMQIYRRCFEETIPNFDPKVANRKIINSLFAWVWRHDAWNYLNLDYDKGFWLYGDLGQGKSSTLLAMRKYIAELVKERRLLRDDWRLGWHFVVASELAMQYAAEGQGALATYCNKKHGLLIDEVGREPIPANNYGTKLNVVRHVIEARYPYRRMSVTCVTTNMGLEDIEPTYGDFIADRCKEMFNFIKFKGKSLR